VNNLKEKYPPLNFPPYQLSLKKKEGNIYVFDDIRKKELVLTPEEWVRQHCVHFANNVLEYPKSCIALEGQLRLNEQIKRFDGLLYKKGKPQILIECKAPSVKINQEVFDQIARYNLKLNVPYLWVTNGISHFFATINYTEKKYDFIKELPSYTAI
jgi:methyltransferase-like protein